MAFAYNGSSQLKGRNNSVLRFRAGPGAFQEIKANGFAAEQIGTIAGASGGAKWLALSQMDKVIAATVLPKLQGPVHLLGSSIGAWRMACFAQSNPLAAIEKFEELYLTQSYSEQPDTNEISAVGRKMLDDMLENGGAESILQHPQLRLHIMTVLCRHITSTDQRTLLGAGLVTSMVANLISRRTLGLFYSRALFSDQRDEPPFAIARDFPIRTTALSVENMRDALMASGSIPMVLNGVRDIAGAPSGTYRDGGIIDYHLDLPTSSPDKLTLYPHFFSLLKPGWFDRQIPWRSLNPAHTDRTLVICPSEAFIASLPNAKVPDRTDFVNFSQDERVRLWRKAVDQCQALADELHDVLENGQLAERLEPL